MLGRRWSVGPLQSESPEQRSEGQGEHFERSSGQQAGHRPSRSDGGRRGDLANGKESNHERRRLQVKNRDSHNCRQSNKWGFATRPAQLGRSPGQFGVPSYGRTTFSPLAECHIGVAQWHSEAMPGKRVELVISLNPLPQAPATVFGGGDEGGEGLVRIGEDFAQARQERAGVGIGAGSGGNRAGPCAWPDRRAA